MAAETDTSKPSELTVDIIIGGLGKTGESLSSMVQKTLLESFKAAANLEDLATRLVVPISFMKITAARVVSAHGYDAYKITIAVKSDDPNKVVREIFTAAIGVAATPVGVIAGNFISGPIAGAVGGVGASIGASKIAGYIWDEALQNTTVGQWSIGQMTDSFGIGLKITQGSLGNADSSMDVPSANQTPDTALIFDPASNQAGVVFRDKTLPATGNGKLYDVSSTTLTQGALSGHTISTTTNTQTGEVSHHWQEADGSRSRGNVAANGNVSFLDKNSGALHIYKGGDYVGSFGLDHMSLQINGMQGRYTYDPASGVITGVTSSVGGAPIYGFTATRHSDDGRAWSAPTFDFSDRQAVIARCRGVGQRTRSQHHHQLA